MSKRVKIWASKIQGYNAEINYIKGASITLADMLSRLPESSEDEAPRKMSVTDEVPVPDVSDRSYEIGVINSNVADLNRFASCKFQENDQLSKPDSFGSDMST